MLRSNEWSSKWDQSHHSTLSRFKNIKKKHPVLLISIVIGLFTVGYSSKNVCYNVDNSFTKARKTFSEYLAQDYAKGHYGWRHQQSTTLQILIKNSIKIQCFFLNKFLNNFFLEFKFNSIFVELKIKNLKKLKIERIKNNSIKIQCF